MYLRTFLMKHPRPTRIDVGTTSGEVKRLDVSPDVTWSHLADAVEILQPVTVQCIDSEGTVLRAIKHEDLDIDEREPAAAPSVQPYMARMQLATPQDPQSAMLLMFAQLLSDAYRHTTDIAFARMVDLFEAVNTRHASTERSLELMHKLLRKALETAGTTEPEAAPDMLGNMLGAFLQSQGEGQAAATAAKKPPTRPVTNGHSNGKPQA